MSAHRSLFVAPCYYTGTSFERIFTAISHRIQLDKLPIDILVGDSLDNTLTGGALDDVRYTQAQADMLSRLIKKLSTNQYDRILFIDFFNPGMELVRYFSEQTQHEVKMASLLHGGTFVAGDIYDADWVRQSEKLWGSLYERVYVPSDYALSQLPDTLKAKTSVHPWGMDNVALTGYAKPYSRRAIDVIFPHRLNADKGTDDLANIIRSLPDVTFVVTSPSSIAGSLPAALSGLDNLSVVTCASTADLHKVMGDSKVVLSCAKQELFGYSVAEAVSLGCIPVAPRNQVYTELYDEKYLYDGIGGCCALIQQNLQLHDTNSTSSITTSFLPLLQDFLEV